MSRVKDIWFADMERRFHEMLDQGIDEDTAYEKASSDAYNNLGDSLADLADRERKRMKGE